MQWINKVKMAELGDKARKSKDDMEVFKAFILEHIKTFDFQSWHIFLNLIDLSEVKHHTDFYGAIYGHLLDVLDGYNSKMDMVAMVRLEALIELCNKNGIR